MKRLFIALLLMITAAAALAEEPKKPVFRVIEDQQPEKRVQVDIGMVQIRNGNTRVRIAYLPLLAPLPYSYPRTTTEVPNPLVLTGTQIPLRRATRVNH